MSNHSEQVVVRNGNGNGISGSNKTSASPADTHDKFVPLTVEMRHGTAVTPAQEAKQRAEGYQLMHGISATVQQGIYDYAYKVAVDSGADETHEDDLEAVEGHAEQAAQESYRDLFDENLYRHDALHAKEHERHRREREEATLAEKHAAAEARASEQQLAEIKTGSPPAPLKQTLWLVIILLAAAGITISVVPTLHDFIFVFDDEVLAWLASVVAGYIVGLTLILMIFADGDTQERSGLHWVGVAAGVVVACALCGLRLRDAQSTADYYYAISLSLFEIGIVLGAEFAAGARRRRQRAHGAAYTAYAARAEDLERATARHAANIAHYQRCHERVETAETAVRNDIAYVEGRNDRYLHIDDFKAAMIAAARAGYQHGIATNRGRILGAHRR